MQEYRQDVLDQRKQQAEDRLDNSNVLQSRRASWDNALGQVDEATFAQINALAGNGRQKGSGLPTPEAIGFYNTWARANGEPDYGQKPPKEQKPTPLSEDQKIQLEQIRGDMRDLRKELATAKANDGQDKIPGLEAQLKELKAMEAEVVPGGKPAGEATKAATAKAPALPADRKKNTPYLLPNGQTGIWSGTGWLVNQ
jgi:hypothetical protein